MGDYDYDVVIIGSGPAGEGASMQTAKLNRRGAVIERHAQVGGGCTHWGTIPSKALRHAIQLAGEFASHPLFRELARRKPTIAELIATAGSVIGRQTSMREDFYRRNAVPLFAGTSTFVDPHTLAVTNTDGAVRKVTAATIIIATGSRPLRSPGIDFSPPRVFDADTILKLKTDPHSITIYGAGVIGCEYASMFRSLGAKVNLVHNRARLLEFLDDEIVDALAYHLRDQGTIIRHNEHFERLELHDDHVDFVLKSGKSLKTDILLWANGRTPNTDALGLDAVGIPRDDRGRITVNADYQTCLPHVYAVGDVIGPPGLASASYDQGRFAALHCATGQCEYHLVRDIPTGIYTSPEISSIGRTERELTEQRIPYEVGHATFKSLARAQITGQTAGMLKLLFHTDTLEVLGVHCFGANASEIVHIGQAIMHQPPPANTLMYFANTTFNYPTMAEAYRVAALNGLNRVEGR